MESFINEFSNHPDFWLYMSIPFISAAVGYATNALAVVMMFKPLEPWGKPPFFGWQGIIPSKAGKFAGLQMQQVDTLVDINALFKNIDSEKMADLARPGLSRLSYELTDDVMGEVSPLLWESIPQKIKQRIIKRFEKELPHVIDEFLEMFSENVEEYFDARTMVVEKLESEKHILVDLLKIVVEKELKFLVKSGLYFGLPIGIAQMFLWYAYPAGWWMLPVGGFAVGYLTNWCAFNLLFKPLNPIQIGKFKWQGLFLKRQNEVAQSYSTTMTDSVLSPKVITEFMMRRDPSDKLFDLIQRRLRKLIDESAGFSKPLLQLMIGPRRFLEIKDCACQKVMEEIQQDEVPAPITATYGYTREALGLDVILRENMEKLSSKDFYAFVEPLFEEDAWLLYMVGGAIGFFAGWLQFLFMFA